MRFELRTLIDCTKTNARFNKNDSSWHQQQNYLTVIQTLGLRVNPIIEQNKVLTEDVKKSNFGSEYKGKHKIWIIEFRIEYESGLSVQNLENDFNLVPVISGLDETAKFEKNLFLTKDDQYKNIDFSVI